MHNYIFEQRAVAEYKEALLWYMERSIKAAENFEIALLEKLNEICISPPLYGNTTGKFSETNLKKYPYSIIYFVEEEIQTVVVISVFHHKRNPKLKYKR